MSVNKFKVGDVVKCVDNDGFADRLMIEKEYLVTEADSDNIIIINDDMNKNVCYYSYRFELSDSDSANAQQPPKFKEGDMVYLIGFNYFKPCKLTLSNCEYSQHLELKVVMDDGSSETFTENGCYTTDDTEPSIVLATEEHRQMLNKLLGVEYEPVKLTGSDLAKKLLKDNPQTCYVSDISDNDALSNGCVLLLVEFENSGFITTSGLRRKFAVPCDSHGKVLENELHELENEVDSLKRELENIER